MALKFKALLPFLIGIVAVWLIACLSAPGGASLPTEEQIPMQMHTTPAPAEPACSVYINQYAPEEWNGGYGHYDLTVEAPAFASFRIRLGADAVECETITLSYGATDGDNSPARVHLYPQRRSDHVPLQRIEVHSALKLEDFKAFMRWFMDDFARYSGDAGVYHVFDVIDADFESYSIASDTTCASAAAHLLKAIPGALEEVYNPRADAAKQMTAYLEQR